MQQQGMARPSPQLVEAQTNANQLTALNQQMQAAASPYQPSVQSAMQAAQRTVDNASAGRGLGQFQYSGTVDALGSPLMNQVMQLLNDPTQGLNEAAQSNFDRQNRVIGREFTDLRENLNENMAARGLDASTIAATKLGDLGARQAEAQADLAARIQEKLITDRATAMNSAIQAAMGLRGQEADLEKDLFTVNRDTGELEWRRGFDMKKLEQEGAQFGQRLALDGELGRGNLALGQQRLGFDMRRDERDFGYQQTRDRSNDAFRDREFGWRQSTDERDYNRLVDRDRVSDSQFYQRFEFDRDRDTRDYNRLVDRDRIGDEQWQSQFDRQGNWRKEDNRYRDDRDAINDRRWNESWDRDESRWRTGQDQWREQFDWSKDNARTGNIMSLLQGMGFNSMPPGVLENVFKALGIPMPPTTSPRTPGGVSPRSGDSWRNRDDRFYDDGTRTND